MSTQALTTTDRLRDAAVVRATDPYPLGPILGIWASVALPMRLILRVVMPMLAHSDKRSPSNRFLIILRSGQSGFMLIVTLGLVLGPT